MHGYQWALAIVLVAGAIVRIIAILPAGYALDEEITQFAVDGIREHWLPLFPSGALNDRGLPYWYAASIAGALFGDSLLSYRFISAVFGVLGLYLTYAAARLVLTGWFALGATLLLVIFLPHLEASAWARFYSVATTAYLGALTVFLRGRRGAGVSWFPALVALGTLSHELAMTVVLLPVLEAAIDRDQFRALVPLFIGCVAVLVIAGSAVIGLHFLAPNQAMNPWAHQVGSSDRATVLTVPLAPVLFASPWVLTAVGVCLLLAYVALRRYVDAPPVVTALCLLAAGCFQLGVLALVLLCAGLIEPRRIRAYAAYAVVSAACATTFWTLHTSIAAHATASLALMRSLSLPGLVYPWTALLYFARALPITTSLLGLVALNSVLAAPLAVTRDMRLLILLAVSNMVLLGVLNVSPRSRHFIVFWPLVVILAARGLEIVRGLPAPEHRRTTWRTLAALTLACTLAAEQYRYGRDNPVVPSATAGPSLAVPRVATTGWADLLGSVPRDAAIVTNDELASAYHLRRVDYWLATSASDLSQYAVDVGTETRGLYGNGRLISSRDDLVKVTTSIRHPWALVLFNTGRFDYAGHRQLALDVVTGPEVNVRETQGLFVMLVP